MRKKAEILEAFQPRDLLNGFKSFYLVGIGGAGMSGIAKMLVHRGFSVAGSDSTESPVTAELFTEGIRIRIGHSGEGIQADDAVILSDAIDLTTSPEFARAHELGCPLFRRSQLLGWLLKDLKILAVTGTHGKTTTSGMLGSALRTAKMDPTIVVGAGVPQFGGPIVEGHGKFAVVEACEAYDSFHDLDPYIVLLTNLELDHVDFHGSYEGLLDSVVRFVNRIPAEGCLIFCADDSGARDVAARFPGRKLGYSRRAFEEVAAGNEEASFGNRSEHETVTLTVPGEHNQYNASGAITAAIQAGADATLAAQGIAAFSGAERRLQVMRDGPIVVVDDYAHHPSEIEASILALRERYPDRRLVVVYQPHLYSRTADLIPQFAKALSLADKVVLTDIYPAREAPMAGVSSSRIAELLTCAVDYVPSRHLLPQHVALQVRPGDLVVGMGAGNIGEFVPSFLRELDRSGSLKVAVIYGGDSAEREVSLHSGIAIERALKSLGYEAKLYDVTDLLLNRADVSPFTGANRPDVAFLAVHGTHAEDGAIQGFFELLHIPYTGSGIQSSAIAMDKRLTKQILEVAGLPVARGQYVTSPTETISIKPPLIVKPNAQGSTVGLSFVYKLEDIQTAIDNAFQYDHSILVEELISGMEISVPVMGDKALPVVEIAPANGQYDFAAKYTPGATEEIVPARLPQHVAEKAQKYALQAHQALRCEGATRTDMIVSGEEPVILEVNTLPGMTGTSLLPNSAKAAGISFEALVQWIVQDALRRHGAKTQA
jgi:UDP-N-acetylmuramate--L-alanine ligase